MTLTLRTIYEYPNGTGQIVLEEGRADLWTFFMEQQEIVYPEQVVSPTKSSLSRVHRLRNESIHEGHDGEHNQLHSGHDHRDPVIII